MKDVAIGVGADNRIVLPAVKKERLGRSDSANFSADLRDMASWTEVNKYRSDFFAYELQQEEKTRTAALKKTQDELAHQRREGLAQKAAKKDEVRRAAAEEAERYALYLKDKAADDAKRAAKVKMEGEMRSNQTEERRARRAVEQRLKELEDCETLRIHSEQTQAAREAYARKVKQDEVNNRMFVEEVGRHRAHRASKFQEEEQDQLRLNAQWKDILDQQEAKREEQYRILREKGQKAQKTYESNAGAVDKAREAKEEENRVRWHAQFERETKAKDEARKAHRKKMERECIDGCMLQMTMHRREKEEARVEALELKLRMIEQAKEEKEERRREREEELARASRYQQVLAAQVHEVQTGRANDPASHVMTAIEASLNRPLLVSMRERNFAGFNSTLG